MKEEIVERLRRGYEVIKDITDNGQIKEMLSYMNLEDICRDYLNKQSFDEDDKSILKYIIEILQYVYNDTDLDMIISDEEYDKLYSYYKDETGNDIVGSVNIKDRPVAYHKYPDLRGTLDKVHFISRDSKPKGEKRKSIEEWINSCENKLNMNLIGRNIDDGKTVILMTPKWDGLSCVLETEKGKVKKALTRGDVTTNEAVDLSAMFYGLPVSDIVPLDEPFGLKTEVVMQKVHYDIMVQKEGMFKNQRSVVSSILNSKDLDRKYLEYLTIMPLQYQSEDMDIPEVVDNDKLNIPYRKFDFNQGGRWDKVIEDNMNSLIEEVKQKYPGVNTDGIVIRLLDETVQSKLGRADGINKFEVAYKTPPETKKTILNDIEYSLGILGAVTPVAKIEPIVIKGNTIKNVSLGSIERAKSLSLAKGDEVIIKYDVIPYLDFNPDVCSKSGNEPILPPTRCPKCGEELIVKPVLKCINDNCPIREIGKLINYVEKMKIPFLNEGIITTLYNEGYLNSIKDLYSLQYKEKQICELDGFGKKSFDKILSGINSVAKAYDFNVIGSLGIPYIGQRILNKILNIYYLSELIDICSNKRIDKLISIEGIKEVTANKIIEGINNNIELIMFLQNELELIHEDNNYKYTVCFTKIRDKEFEKYLETHNVKVTDKYSKEVDILIIPTMNTSSSKVDKAVKQGKKILDIQSAYKMFNYK